MERRIGWFETSFMPGRRFDSPADFNDQFTDWLSRANARVVRTTKAAPVDLIDADRAAMLALPPVALHLGWRNKIRLGRDYYVRLDQRLRMTAERSRLEPRDASTTTGHRSLD